MQVGTLWRTWLGVFFWLLCALGSGEARARPPAPGQAALVERGEAALRAGELTAAEQALTAAYLQAPHAELLFQLARLAAAQQQLLTAQDLMRRYLNDPTAAPDADKTAEAHKVLSQLRPPSGKVRVQGDPGGFVLLDGRLLGRLPLVQPLLAAPGPHTVVIKYPGKLLDAPIEVAVGRMVDIQCTRATGAVFLATLPSVLVVLAVEPSSPMMSEQLLDAIERAAHGQQLTVLKPEALIPLAPELKELPAAKALAELKRCLARPDCLPRMLHLAKLDHALRVSVKQTALPAAANPPVSSDKPAGSLDIPPAANPPVASDKPARSLDGPPLRWDFSLELVHADLFGAASALTRSCSPCREAPAIAALQEATSQTLAAGLNRPRGNLAVSSEPAGAEVRVGDQLLGQTPLALAAWTGEYALELRQPGRQPVHQAVRVESGQTASLTVTLPLLPALLPAPLPPPPAPPPVAALPAPQRWERAPRPRWRTVVGGTALFFGLTLTALGGLVFAINQGSGCPPADSLAPPPPGCAASTLATQYNVGVSLMPVGGALALTGIGLLAVPGPRRLVAAPSASPGPDQPELR